ncbi:E3 ubiquitin/ISG15 ligase TRIM25 isoform X1 [Triplophysa dalaica]|uniref:E3 ubiquitin/ISG15 ligase TRIM25 isoform X1 n=1 Tax=Triplophysa dalaica TaxID=1582913 RepID=UPI0024DF6015|nr:E3 ubiquitin/ISG15 ligase TRIM25 isoform X1 [Triplophysa dalaica]
MAENMSLLSLEDDLTCSICLGLFENPVSLICGHSFCANCLDATWNDRTTSMFCPHCRMPFSSKPELKKNTVLSAVLDAYRVKAGVPEPVMEHVEERRRDPDTIKCDTCMEAEAVKTCLTCMASYCEDHLRPHRDNIVFRSHQLSDPLPDLLERLCPDHSKLMEFYCTHHQCCICSSCLQSEHKGCNFTGTDEQHHKQKTGFMDKLNILDVKIDKNLQVVLQMKDQQNKLKDMALTRKRILEAEYTKIREMIDRDEKEAVQAIDKELEAGQSRLLSLMKKFNENIDRMSRTKSEINSLLDQSHSFTFLKASVDLPSVVNFEPKNPRINVDSQGVIAHHSSAVALKEWIAKLLDLPPEKRIPLLQAGFREPVLFMGSGPMHGLHNQFSIPPSQPNFGQPNFGQPNFGQPRPFMQPRNVRSPSPGAPLRARGKKKDQNSKSHANTDQKDQSERKERMDRKEQSPNRVDQKDLDQRQPQAAGLMPGVPVPGGSLGGDGFAKRSDLLKYGTILNFDVKTAHKRIVLSENNTKATVTDEPTDYPDIRTRFSVCSQVLCTKGFSQGRHYWEIKMSSNNFCGLGLAFGTIDRKGPSSRLGRNAESWCVEWFNVKLSAWHNSIETVLENPNPSRVGILLDCDEGSATFYNVKDRAFPFHTFVFPFSKPVYPAFWIFSNGSNVSLCKLTS